MCTHVRDGWNIGKPLSTAIRLLDALPYLAVNLTSAPQLLQRQLYDATRLSIQLHHETREATMTIPDYPPPKSTPSPTQQPPPAQNHQSSQTMCMQLVSPGGV